MFRKYILLFPLAVLCPALATVTFPNAGGDLSDFSVFGDKVNEENFLTNNIKIDKAGTYTASTDFTIGGLYVNKADANVVIDMTAAATGADGDRARTINLTGALATDGLNNFTHIQGGTWNMNGKGVRASQGFNKNHDKAKLRITGADINNVGTVAGGYGSTGVEVIIDGASRINTSNLRPDHDRGTSALLVISNGSVVTTANFLGSNGSKLDLSYGYSTKTVVTDEDTSLAVSSSFKFGASPCAQFFLTKGACLNVAGSDPYIGTNSGDGVNHTNLYFEISDGAKCDMNSSNLYFQQYSHHGTLAILNGGELNLTGNLLLNGNAKNPTNSGHSATLFVSNGIYSSPHVPNIGSSSIHAGSNGVVRIMGKKSRFNITGDDTIHLLFANSPNCMYELIDAVWTNLNASVHYNAQGGVGNHSVILRDNSEYYSTNSFAIANRNYNSTNNTLQVLSGSRLFAGKEIYTSSTDNSFIVSNGVIETLGDFTVTMISYSDFMDGFSNNYLVVQGDMPKVIVTNGTLAVNYQSKLRFDLPSSGYQEGIVPVKVDKLVITADSDIIINNALERINELEETQHVTLVEASTRVSVPAGVIERVNATLPEGSYCYVSDDSKELMIKLYKEKGTMIIVR